MKKLMNNLKLLWALWLVFAGMAFLGAILVQIDGKISISRLMILYVPLAFSCTFSYVALIIHSLKIKREV